MRVTIVGATGNVGTSLLSSLADEPEVDSILGVARRKPKISIPDTRWIAADIAHDDLVPTFRGSDVVVHLAWLIQPSHQREVTRTVNQIGTRRVFEATAAAGVPNLVYASSVGAYSPGPKEHGVDESWPTRGVATSFYSVDKAATERMLDSFEEEHPDIRVVRMRPGLIFKREVGAGVRRLFAGPLFPGFFARPKLIPLVPDIPSLRFQCVHSYDVGEAYRRAIVSDVRGAFNIAAEPVLDPKELAKTLDARRVPIPPRALRALINMSWLAHLQPTPPGWLDLGLQTPLIDPTRAHDELGWRPRFTSKEALTDLLAGMRAGAGLATPPLEPRAGGLLRFKEFLTGIGERAGARKEGSG